MLPKNKLRNARLNRLRIYEEGPVGSVMKNVTRRFDSMSIASPEPKDVAKDAENMASESNVVKITKALRQDDTPPLGSLGGQLPKAAFVPKVKAEKVKRNKPAPGQMKIFDAEGREWGRRKWKEIPSTVNVGATTR